MATEYTPISQPVIVVEATQVYGLRIPNREAAKYTRRIISLSLFLLLMQVLVAFYQVASVGEYYYLGGGFLGVLVPLCGYYGAKYKNRTLLSMFSFCNCLYVIVIPLFVFALVVVGNKVKSDYPDVCPGNTTYPKWPNHDEVAVQNEELTCEQLAAIISSIPTLLWVIIPVSLTSFAVACLSCTWGWKLRNMDYFVSSNMSTTTTAVATTGIRAQHGPIIVGEVYNDKSVPTVL